MRTEATLKISGMHCKSCAALIHERLSNMEGVEKAEVSYPDENAKLAFEDEKVSMEKIGKEIKSMGYSIVDPKDEKNKGKQKSSLREGIIYGLTPHVGCIAFIIASVLGVTVAVNLFKPLLLNPWFFHILVLLSLVFATISAALYLRNNGILSWEGVMRKKKYLATMYGSTLAINLALFLFIFPLTANLDTGYFAAQATRANAAALPVASLGPAENEPSIITLQVNIPCSGHASLISGELKKIEGVSGVKFSLPNKFDVAYDPSKTSKEKILALEVFKTYPAKIVADSSISKPDGSGLTEGVVEAQALSTPSPTPNAGSGQSSGYGGCGGSSGGGCGAGASSGGCCGGSGGCGCGAR